MSTGMSASTEGKSSLTNVEEYMNAWKASSGTQKTSVDFDEAAKEALDASLADTSYSKGAAISDAKAAADAMAKSVLEAGAPGVASTARGGGGYDSTTETMLQNDLATRAGSAGSQVILDTIAKYSAAQSQAIAARTGAVSATSGKTTTTDMTETSGTQGGKSTREDSFKLGTGGEGGTVICTQLFIDGHIHADVYKADQLYVTAHFCEATINGYRAWAVPFVYAMRANKLVYALGKYFGTRWCNHCAAHYITKPGVTKNTATKIAMWFGVPLCFILGSVLPEVKYYKLWEGS